MRPATLLARADEVIEYGIRSAHLARAMPPHQLGRFGTMLTSGTQVGADRVVTVACKTLAKRLENVAAGMVPLGLWDPRVVSPSR
jgi:hypothetical protein